jgi:RNA polymerase sigma-70 factor, ECF subfamily
MGYFIQQNTFDAAPRPAARAAWLAFSLCPATKAGKRAVLHRSAPHERLLAKRPGPGLFHPELSHLLNSADHSQFERVVLPHLDAAYNLARWLCGNERDAEDITQEASLRAFKFFSGFRGGDARSWLLTIVRRTAWTWLRRHRQHEESVEFDEELHGGQDVSANPEVVLVRADDVQTVRQALETLPALFREVLVLRELEGCSYKEIAEIAGVPVGTVMSRLARARSQLQTALSTQPHGDLP